MRSTTAIMPKEIVTRFKEKYTDYVERYRKVPTRCRLEQNKRVVTNVELDDEILASTKGLPAYYINLEMMLSRVVEIDERIDTQPDIMSQIKHYELGIYNNGVVYIYTIELTDDQ